MNPHYRVALALVLVAAAAHAASAPDLVLLNARVWTGNPKQPWAQAIAVAHDRIAAVGSTRRIRAMRARSTRVIDAGGRLVIPGFNDAHVHFIEGSIRLGQVELTGARDLDEMKRRIEAWVDANPHAPWVLGGGWEYDKIPGGLPTKEDLDEVTRGKPAMLAAYDGHTGWANSAALRNAGVGKGYKFKGFGEVVLDAAGEPTGILKEHAQAVVRRFAPDTTHKDEVVALREGLRLAARLGITSIENASGGEDLVAVFRESQEAGELTVRVGVAASIGARTRLERIPQIAQWSKQYSGTMLRVNAVKIVLDGVVESHTAAMLAPYTDDPSTSGTSQWTQEHYNDVVARCDRAGLQVLTHAIGDRAVRMALDGYENMFRVNGRHDARPRVEHIETIDPADLPRFARIGAIPSFMPIHADPSTSDFWTKAIGFARSSRGFAWRSMQKTGAPLVFSSDWPASISVNPLEGIYCALTRKDRSGKPPGGWFPSECVSLDTALRAYTYGGAYASFEEQDKGTLERGKLADFVVLSRDLFRIPARSILSTKVLLTSVGGKIVFNELPSGSRKMQSAPTPISAGR